jgi:hypothetical protein
MHALLIAGKTPICSRFPRHGNVPPFLTSDRQEEDGGKRKPPKLRPVSLFVLIFADDNESASF